MKILEIKKIPRRIKILRFKATSAMLKTAFTCLSIAVLTSLVSCKSRSFNTSGDSTEYLAEEMWTWQNRKVWDELFMAERNSQSGRESGIQNECGSKVLMPPNGTSLKGAVLLYHGFTACPQQFVEWAQKELVSQGYAVLLPLIPGHGRNPYPKSTQKDRVRAPKDLQPGTPQMLDNLDDLPTNQNWQVYKNFAAQMNFIMENLKVPARVVGGLSVGGVLATSSYLQAAQNSNRQSKPYDRGLFMVPFFGASNPIANALAEGKSADLVNLLIHNKNLGWGKGCFEERFGNSTFTIKGGRGGTCDLKFAHISGAIEFGEQTLRDLKTMNSVEARIQWVAAEEDPVVNNGAIDSSFQHLSRVARNSVAFCSYLPNQAGAKVNHSLFSKFDAPLEDKFWQSNLFNDARNFITDGTFFPKSTRAGVSKLESAYPCQN